MCKVYAISIPMRATYSTNLILLDMITLTIFNERYELWSSSLRNLHKPPTKLALSLTKFHAYGGVEV
jgi:hypothetical protein